MTVPARRWTTAGELVEAVQLGLVPQEVLYGIRDDPEWSWLWGGIVQDGIWHEPVAH